MAKLMKSIVKVIICGAAGGVVMIVVLLVLYLDSRPPLNVWHEVGLDAEFTANRPVKSFTDYLTLEKQVFAQLDELILERVPDKARNTINRFNRGSLSDPSRWSPNWNRTFEFASDIPQAGVLLLHGMSDSPYSLRQLGLRLREAGAWVIGLRLPGHGTAPSGLVQVKWEDMAEAVRLAMAHLGAKVGKRKIYIVGYSNGGALAVNYALSCMDTPALTEAAGIVLISPSIGVTAMAALAKWQARLGHFLGLKKLEWNSILPEYDPFKYNSFAVNAGDQVHRITTEIQSQIESLDEAGKLTRFPPILAFQSIVDATVSTHAVIDGLFRKLPKTGHDLVLFDFNRISDTEHLFTNDSKQSIEALFKDPDLSFTLSLVTNASGESHEVVIVHKMPGSLKLVRKSIGMKWPNNLYSLSHVALPFSEDDPLYGIRRSNDRSKIQLGNIDFRGERGALAIPAADMLRLRWNPFYSFMERRILEFMGFTGPSKAAVDAN